MGDLHVIAAGSLLEFALVDKNISFPVGRVHRRKCSSGIKSKLKKFKKFLNLIKEAASVQFKLKKF